MKRRESVVAIDKSIKNRNITKNQCITNISRTTDVNDTYHKWRLNNTVVGAETMMLLEKNRSCKEKGIAYCMRITKNII